MNAHHSLRIGIDLGGTKIAAIAFGESENPVFSARVPTPRGDYDGVIRAIAGLVEEAEKAAGVPGGSATVGVGMPGSISPRTGRVQNANSVWMNGRAFGDDLKAALARPLRLANDANCLALSEATDGAARGARTVFGVIIGTGCGGGLVVDGRIISGRNRIGGEWGHNPLPWADGDEHPGPECWCGRRGCLETWISGTGLERDYHARTGGRLSGEQIAAAARDGDAQAAAALARHAERLARGLAHVVNLFDPEVIVLGGGLSMLPRLYDVLPELMRPWVFCDDPAIDVHPPAHGPASGVRGAARLWDDGQDDWTF